MIIVKLRGGIGNQLFQYAFGKALSSYYNTVLKLDNSWYMNCKSQSNNLLPYRAYLLNRFQIKEDIASIKEIDNFRKEIVNVKVGRLERIFKKCFVFKSRNVFLEPSLSYCSEVFNVGRNTYFIGFWQTERYFLPLKDIIVGEFNLKDEYSIDDFEITKLIKSCNSVSIHVRRGDYEHIANKNKHGLCPLQYYKDAIDCINKEKDNPHYFCFSDDIEWVRNNFKFNHQATYIPNILKDFQELILMSHCKHNIIANSSFSWWGAWLNKNPDKTVIAPKLWLADTNMNKQANNLVPNNWIRI